MKMLNVIKLIKKVGNSTKAVTALSVVTKGIAEIKNNNATSVTL